MRKKTHPIWQQFLLALISLAAMGCGSDGLVPCPVLNKIKSQEILGNSPIFRGVLLRIQNASELEMTDIQVEGQDFANLAAEAVSAYQYMRTGPVYASMAIQLQADGQLFTLQPIDHVGEEVLANGDYTAVLRIEEVEGERVLRMELITDRLDPIHTGQCF